jgi:hydroxymethylpyrimidine pyrophosphatase-like HAD family hydrolase
MMTDIQFDIQAILLDLDGVIIGDRAGYNSPMPHPDVISKIGQIADNGVKIILCTARPPFGFGSLIQDINLNNAHIADGGAIVMESTKGRILKRHTINADDVRKLLNMCLSNDIYTQVHTTESYFIQTTQVSDLTSIRTYTLQCEPVIVDDLVGVSADVTKIIPVVRGQQGKTQFTALFNSLGTDLVLNWAVCPNTNRELWLAIITAAGISKRESALEILSNMGISPENTLGIGDSTGDWQYIEFCKYAGIMGNSHPELIQLASAKGVNTKIGGHVDQNGVLEIFDYFKL